MTSKTSRLIADAYPEAFDGLDDVTLRDAAVPTGLLAGTSVPLARAADRLADEDTLWVIRWSDYPAEAVAREDAVLQAAGLERDRDWPAANTVVTRWVRR